MDIEEDREEPPKIADERTSLATWLDYQRATLLVKCQGLSGEALAQASAPPSTLTLLGLLQHMLGVEWWWFEHIFVGGDAPEPFATGNDPEWEFTHLLTDQVEETRARFEAQCAHSRAIVEAADSLDVLAASDERTPRDLRWIMVHMIEEYARHNGHADLLREAIDGEVGD
jgi:hypothetical protein